MTSPSSPTSSPSQDIRSTWLDEAITTREASDLLSIPVATLTTWRSRRKGPGYLKLAGKTVRYQRRTLLDWMAQQQPRGKDKS